MCLRVTNVMIPEYGYLLLHAYDLQKVLYGLGSGLRQNLAWKDLRDLLCLLPPLDEQAAIVAHLARVAIRVESAIGHAQQEVALLREFRTRLTADVVTGAVDVRAAAAALPDEADEPLEREDAEDLEAADEGDLDEEAEYPEEE